MDRMQYVTANRQNGVEMALATADRREWRVHIDLGTLERVAGRAILSEEDARGTVNGNVTMITLAALRAIGRGVTGEIVRLSPYDLRLPPVAKAA
jgi:hypothetical protein